jgi:uncharacterized protein (DUF362 family)/Pyruvate/2-oxoacid:ferredoxin oxidoreductase delta subunit
MPIVSLECCDNYDEQVVYEAIEKLINHIGGWKSFIKPGHKVAIKPNLLMFKRPEEAATTHPSVVKAVISQIQKAGGIVTIVESPGGPYNTAMLKRVYKATGMEKVADETGAILNYDLRVSSIAHESSKYIKQMEILKPLAEADIIVNLPKLKTHTMMTYTGAIKNMFGAIAGTAKADLHLRMPDYDKFADSLIDIFLSIKPTLNLMDAIEGMEGYGPTNGNPKHIGLLLASVDGFALDDTALKIIQLNAHNVPVMVCAKSRGLLDEEVTLCGVQLENVLVKDYDIPILNEVKRRGRFNRGLLKLVKQWMRPKPQIQSGLCIHCGSCAQNCPPDVITFEKGKTPVIDYENCIRCFCCLELCAHNAITVHRSLLSRMMMNKKIAGLK